MSKPWEAYQQTAPQEAGLVQPAPPQGPWTQYQATEAAPAPKKAMTRRLEYDIIAETLAVDAWTRRIGISLTAAEKLGFIDKQRKPQESRARSETRRHSRLR
jgi:phage terminase small subunit